MRQSAATASWRRVRVRTDSHSWSANVSDGAAIHAPGVRRDEQPTEGQTVPIAITIEDLGDCDGGYECECLIHVLEREQRVALGPQHHPQAVAATRSEASGMTWTPRRRASAGVVGQKSGPGAAPDRSA